MIRHHSTWTAWIGLFTLLSLGTIGAWTAAAPDVSGSSVRRADASGPRQGFELNQGQVGPEFAFVTRGDGYDLRLGPTEADLWLPHTVVGGKGDRRDGQEWTPDVLRLSYLGAQVPSVVGIERLRGRVHYLVGSEPKRWRTNIPTFAAVRYENLYPGVNLVVRGDLRALEFTFVVAPGANPEAIRLESEGARLLDADPASGGMILRTARSEVRAERPRAYQEADDVVQDLAVEYGVGSDHEIGFHIPSYDPERPLLLQLRLWRSDSRPTEGSQDAARVAVDAQGSVFVAGRVPIGLEERGEAFVSKLAADMTPLYTTYLGGDGEDVPSGMAIDRSGNVVLAGSTRSTDFPTVGGVQRELAGSADAFVSKLSADGSTLLFSTYLGGEGEDEALDIATDATGGAWVTGRTRGAGFPTTYGARQPESGGMSDAFIGRLSPDGSTLLYASYLGGKGEDEGNAIGVDGLGNVHLAGTTRSADLPIENALQPSPPASAGPGAADAFVATLSADGGRLLHATYLGGSGDDAATSLAVDASGNAFVAGRTASADFPATGGAIQTALGGRGVRGLGDAFVAKLDAAGGALLHATLLGGALDDEATGIGADARGNAWIAGTTSSTDFPTAGGAPGRVPGKRDAFVAEIAPTGDVLLRSTFIGGRDDDAGLGVAVSSHGAVIVGAARSIELGSAKPLMPAFSGGRIFVTQLPMASVEAAGCPGTINFDNSAGTGLWQTTTNWDLDRLPISTDDVCIAGFSVTHSSGTDTIGSLTVGSTGSLALTVGTLNLTTASQIDGSFTLSGTGILGGAGELTVNGATTWTGGTMTGAGTTNANGGISFGGSGVKDLTAARILNTAGTTAWAGTGGIRPGSGAVINNSGIWDCQSNTTMANPFGGTAAFNNSGTFKKSTLAGTTTVSIPFNNSVTVDVQTGTLILSGGGTSGGTFTGLGTLQFSAGTHDLQAASSVNVPAVTVSGGTVNLAGSLGGGSLTISGGTINVNSVVAANPTALSLSGGTLGGTGTISISGLTTWTGGAMTGAGTTNTNGGITFSGSLVKDLTASRTLNTAGTTTLTGIGPVRAGSGAVINNSGTWDCQSDINAISNPFGGMSAFNNSGTFKKSAGAGATAVSIPFNNSLTVDVQAGTLSLSGGGTSSGTFTGSATLQFGGGTSDLQAASSISIPTVVVSAGTVNLGGSYNATSATTVSGGTANFSPTGTVSSVGGSLTISSGVANFSSGEAINTTTLSFSGGTLSGTDTVTVSGLTTWTSGTMTGAGTTNANGGIAMSGGSVKDLTLSRILNAAGTTAWTGAGGVRAGTGAVIYNSGIWDAQSDATISNAFGGTSAFNNSGTFKKSAGAGNTAVSIPFNNASTVDVQSGTLNLSGGGTSSGTFTGSGTLQFSSGTHDLQAASSVNVSTVTVSGGTVNLSGSLSGASLTISVGTINVNSVGAANATALVFSSGTLGGTGTIGISGLTTWTGGAMTGAGVTTTNGGISFSGSAVKDLTTSRTLNTAGTTTWAGIGPIHAGSGAVINNSGTWDCQSDATMSNVFGGTSAFNNSGSGTFKKSAGAGATAVSIPFNNAGSVQGLAGALNFTTGYIQTAGSTILNGGAISSTTTMDIQGGSLSGVGTVTANVTSAGQVAPGLSPGILGISGNYTQSSPGAFSVEIGGVTPGVQYDQLTVTGTGVATMAGTLNVSLISGFTPVDGDSFTIMTAVSRSGSFATVNLPPLPVDRGWRLTYGSTSIVLDVVTDTDGDGTNDVFDCAPLDPGAFAIPGQVTGDAFGSDNQTYSWTSAGPSSGSATVHDVMRGALNQFPVGSGIAETCVGSGLSGSSIADGTAPSSRSGFYYLVRARNVCGTGTRGFATSGAERTSAACP